MLKFLLDSWKKKPERNATLSNLGYTLLLFYRNYDLVIFLQLKMIIIWSINERYAFVGSYLGEILINWGPNFTVNKAYIYYLSTMFHKPNFCLLGSNPLINLDWRRQNILILSTRNITYLIFYPLYFSGVQRALRTLYKQ